jgi:hypothetical protein
MRKAVAKVQRPARKFVHAIQPKGDQLAAPPIATNGARTNFGEQISCLQWATERGTKAVTVEANVYRWREAEYCEDSGALRRTPELFGRALIGAQNRRKASAARRLSA